MIGVYGGTFDPVHYGHLRPALEVYEAFGLSELRFIPCGQPPHRDAPLASAEQRLAMVEQAISNEPGFVADAREIRRSGPSYMVDTLRSLQAEQPDQALCLLLGMDAFAGFHQWHEWRVIPDLCNMVVMQRPEFVPEQVIRDAELQQWVAASKLDDRSQFCRSRSGKLMFYPVTQLNISSTRIREAVRLQQSLRYLLPDSVMALIEREAIYQ